MSDRTKSRLTKLEADHAALVAEVRDTRARVAALANNVYNLAADAAKLREATPRDVFEDLYTGPGAELIGS